MKILSLFIIVSFLIVTSVHCTDTQKYDKYFKRYGRLYNIDMYIIKSQCKAESNFNPNAVSPANAYGLMQLLTGTGNEVASKLGIKGQGLFVPETNIMMGAYYYKQQWNVWKNEEGFDRIAYALGSYNAGLKSIIDAQKLAHVKDKWYYIALELPKVTGHHSTETINYIKRIQKYYQEYTGIPFRLKQ